MSALVYVEGETDVPVVSAVMRAAGWAVMSIWCLPRVGRVM